MLFCNKVGCDIHGMLVVENAPNDWGITIQLGRFIWLKIYSPFLSLFWYKVWLRYIRGLLCWECPNDWGITDYSGSSEGGIWLDPLPLSNTLPPNYRIVKYAKHNERPMRRKHTISPSLYRCQTDQNESNPLQNQVQNKVWKTKQVGFKVVCLKRSWFQK